MHQHGGGIQPGPLEVSKLTLPAATLAGNDGAARADAKAIQLGPGLAFTGGSLRVVGSTFDGTCATWADLPVDFPPPVESIYLVRASSGVWLVNRKQAGLYQRVALTGDRAADWSYLGEWLEEFSDANFEVWHDGDMTRALKFSLSAQATGTTVTVTSTDLKKLGEGYYLSTTGTAAAAAKLASARTITIGGAGKAFDGSANQSWSLEEMGAASTMAVAAETAARTDADNALWSALYVSQGISKSKQAPLFVASGQTIVTAQAASAMVAGVVIPIASGAGVTLPALVAGTDYAIYLLSDGTLLASANFSAPDGYTSAEVLQLGGAHYAPGSNATGTSGGNSTPEWNPCSVWDLKFRPKCPDPRGMAYFAGAWYDIYLLNDNPGVYGSSAYGRPPADGATLPVIPTAFGGNGSTKYTAFTWWAAGEIAASMGKQLPSYAALCAATYGVTEQTSAGIEPTATTFDAARTSRCGLIQATGNMWSWTSDLITAPPTTALATGSTLEQTVAWVQATYAASAKLTSSSRGSLYSFGNNSLYAGLHGGNWVSGGISGSRAGNWSVSPASSCSSIGARFRSDHQILL